MGYTVAVLWGGEGCDREVSRAGAGAVCEALEKAGHRAVQVLCDARLAATLRTGGFDAVWPALTGELGRSGEVQELADTLGLALVGCTGPVCRRMRDRRELLRCITEALEVRTIEATVPWTESLGVRGMRDLGAEELLETLGERIPGGYPLVVKPALGGSGVKTRAVGTPEELRDAVYRALEAGDVLVQQQVEGVAMSVCVLGDVDDICVLPPVELCADGGRFVPVRYASLSHDRSDAEAIRSAVERAALDAYLVCGCRGFAEVQLVWDGATPRLLDVNTAPSFARDGVLMETLEACGFDASEEFDALVEAAR